MKVIMLMPCLMLRNNRKANHAAMEYAKQHYPVDEIVVNDAEFLPEDYREGFKYIGHHTERQGFVKTRNELLKYFYDSDADFAIWMDANKRIAKSSLNDFVTIVKALKEGKINTDLIFSTLGIWLSSERVAAKKLPTYFDETYLVKFKGGYDWMHGLVMRNIAKVYGQRLFIDERCDPRQGWPEDVYFTRLLRKLFDYKLAATVTVATPTNKSSTWMAKEKGYKYPKVDYATVNGMIDEALRVIKFEPRPRDNTTIALQRVPEYKELLKPYISRLKKKGEGLLSPLNDGKYIGRKKED